MRPAGPALDLRAQQGRRFVITGALGGLGWELTHQLAGAGAEVTMAVRRPDDALRRAEAAGLTVRARALDLASLRSVREFADETGPVDVLVNNAGVMALPFGLTEDGFETQMGVNHLGHFALTGQLLDRIADRVVVVGSSAHLRGRVDPDHLAGQPYPGGPRYTRFGAYAASKLANLLFLAELDRRLRAEGSPVRAVGAHPGYTATGIVQHSQIRAFDLLAAAGNRLVGMTPAQGAASLLVAATADVPGGSYWGPRGWGGLRGKPAPARRSARARDGELARRVWAASARLTGVNWC